MERRDGLVEMSIGGEEAMVMAGLKAVRNGTWDRSIVIE